MASIRKTLSSVSRTGKKKEKKRRERKGKGRKEKEKKDRKKEKEKVKEKDTVSDFRKTKPKKFVPVDLTSNIVTSYLEKRK